MPINRQFSQAELLFRSARKGGEYKHAVPKITNLRESAGFAGVIRASFMGVLFVIVIVTVPVIAVGAGSASPNILQTTDFTNSHRLLFGARNSQTSLMPLLFY